MTELNKSQTVLGPYRVLDLTDEKGVFCTRLLADLGADVLKIEPPGGDPMRRLGPFCDDESGNKRSLPWLTYNTNKRSITLDLEAGDGQALFKRLVQTADFVVESFRPGYLAERGLGYADLSAINPSLIVTSITPFGQTGPYRDWKASDIVGVAMGGLMNLCGDADRPPVRMPGSQACVQAGLQAAVATLMAHYAREVTGQGQQVDASMQESVTIVTLDGVQQFWDLNRIIHSRQGPFNTLATRKQRFVFACKDGSVAFQPLIRWAFPQLVEWIDEEGLAGDLTGDQWKDRSAFPGPGQYSQEEVEHAEGIIGHFLLQHNKAEIYEEAQRRRIPMSPANKAGELFENEQLAARGYFVAVDHPEIGRTALHPGAPFRLSKTPWQIRRPAPLLGEHNEEVFEKELGLSQQELTVLRESRVI